MPPHAFFRPTWFLSRRLSEEKGQQHWRLHGCVHVRRLAPAVAIDEAKTVEVEALWEKEAEQHLADLTARWTDEQREDFRSKLKSENRFTL